MIELPDPQQVDEQATQHARTFAEAATRPAPQAPAFTPPRPDQWEGPKSGAGFTPPPPSSWEGESKPSNTAERWSGQFGKDHPVLASPVDLAQGVTAGAFSTVFHGGDMLRRLFGMERVINRPEVQQLINTPDSKVAKVGKFGEQAAEFAIPAGAVSKFTKGMGLLMRMGAEGLAAGAVSGVQSGGDPKAIAAGAGAGAAGPAIGAAGSAIGKAVSESRIPQKLYQSALKPTWSMVKKEGLDMLDTGLKDQIPVSAEGLAKVEQKINGLRTEIARGVQVRAAQGRAVDTSKVLATLDDLEDFYKNTAAPDDALNTLKGIRDQFEKYHGQQIPLDKAQQIKINTYQELKKSYGEMASAKIEGLKQVARGLKEQISSVFPEIAGLNEQQSKLLGLDDALYRAVWRIENHQMMGIGSPLAASAGHVMMGGPGAVTAFMGKMLLDDPTIKSKLAIALARGGVRGSTGVVSKRLAALKGSMENVASSLAGGPGAPSGQLVPQPAR